MFKISIPTIITNGHFNKEKTLDALKRCEADRIVLALDRELEYGFSSEENLALVRELTEYYHENGLQVMVWLGETLGHGCGKPFPGNKYLPMRQFERGDIEAFCPMGELFVTDVCKWIQNLAACGVDMIMLDDDFRYYFRGGIGCTCEKHMNAVSAILGEPVDEKTLKSKMFCGGKNRYRSAFLKAQGDGMRDFSKKLREALDEVAPTVRLGFASVESWDAEGWDPIECSTLMAGGTKPFFRIAGAPYWVNSEKGTRLNEVVELARAESAYFKGRGIEFFSEGDTYPRPRHECPAAYLECFDQILRADGGTDGILKYVLDYVSDADYETGYIDAWMQNERTYKSISDGFDGKTAVGFSIPLTMHRTENAELYNDATLRDRLENCQRLPEFHFTSRNSLPVTHESDGVCIIFGENARTVAPEKLKNGAVLDVTAAKILSSRGIDVGISEVLPKKDVVFTGFSALPAEYFKDEGVYTRLAPDVDIIPLKLKDGADPISDFQIEGSTLSSAYLYENADGCRFLVYPFDAYQAKRSVGWLVNYARKRQVLKHAGWLGGKPIPAYVDGNHPHLYTIVKRKGSETFVGIWNLFEDKADSVKVVLDSVPKSVDFIGGSGHLDGNVAVIDRIYPYEFAAVSFIK